MKESILRLPKVLERTGMSKATVYRGIKAGTFPAPVSLGSRAIGWLESSIDEFIESRKVVSRIKAEGGAK